MNRKNIYGLLCYARELLKSTGIAGIPDLSLTELICSLFQGLTQFLVPLNYVCIINQLKIIQFNQCFQRENRKTSIMLPAKDNRVLTYVIGKQIPEESVNWIQMWQKSH